MLNQTGMGLDRETNYLLFKHLGHKNYAYRVKNVSCQTPQFDCLESYIPADNLASNLCLRFRGDRLFSRAG